ncbi:glycosyltransferase [Microbacterium gorillae]|uniref:glycosyltransferase n=1 Tax=Microbacterium gorillae TaxID=1231063 RepID=UPI003D95644D
MRSSRAETPGGPDAGTGFIVLAAYQPDPELFARQVRSIRDQTITDWRCIITADGGPEGVVDLLREAVGDDSRFEVAGYEERLGFYGNFERGLRSVPSDAAWVALSDQDDYWLPTKLATMIPHLTEVAAVAAQARVVRYPSGAVVSETTGRRDVPIDDYILNNQYTGGMMLFRAEVLESALPFPRLPTPAEVHDHWLAVVAHFRGGARVIPDIVQDYVQHDGNVIGEARSERFNPFRSWQTVKRIVGRYEASLSPRAVARVTYNVGVGWRETMMVALGARLPLDTPDLARVLALYGPNRRFWRTLRATVRAARRGDVSPRSLVEYFTGWVLGGVFRLRSRG